MQQTRIFEAELPAVPALVDYVAAFAEARGLPPRRALQLQLAIEEAVVNICRYAYATPPGEIEVALAAGDGQLVIALRDQGMPFDPLAAEPPALGASLEERKLGGLGIFLIGHVVDEVRYCREGAFNVLTLRLALP